MDDPLTGAIRMMAFGVLEHAAPPPVAQMTHEQFVKNAAVEDASLQTEAMIVTEFNALGWKLTHTARYGRMEAKFLLLGAVGGTKAWPVRPKIAEGTLREVCQAAVDWLDNGPAGAPQPEPQER